MTGIKSIIKNIMLILSILVVLILFYLGLNDSVYVLTAFFALGVLLTGFLFVEGFLGMQIPFELQNEEKHEKLSYYSMKSWSSADLGLSSLFLKLITLLIVAIVVFSIILTGVNQLSGQFEVDVTEFILETTQLSWVLLLSLLILPYVGLVLTVFTHEKSSLAINSLDNGFDQEQVKELPEELKYLFKGRINQLVLGFGIAIFLVLGLWHVFAGNVNIDTFVILAVAFPIALIITRVEAKFFYLFGIQQYYQVRNWDILSGTNLRGKNVWNKATGLIKQGYALLTLIILPISFIVTLFGLYGFVTSDLSSSEAGFVDSLIMSLLQTELATIVLFLLALGPLVVFIFKPFAFVEIWLNQGLFEKISSPWDIDTINTNIKQYQKQFRMPHLLPGFQWSVFIASVGVLSYLAVRVCISILVPNASLRTQIYTGFQIVDFVLGLVFVITLIELTWDLIEEKTIWLFGKESRIARQDLINYSLYGEHLVYHIQNMENYLEHNPNSWGLAWFLKGMNGYYDENDRLDALKKALNKILIEAVQPVAWNDYGALLLKKGRFAEAQDALKKALQLSSKDYVDYLKTRENVSSKFMEHRFIMENVPLSEAAMIQRADPMVQMGTGSSSSSGTSTPSAPFIEFDELMNLTNETLSEELEAKYKRRARTKAGYNINISEQELKKHAHKIKELHEHLKDHPSDLNKWIEYGISCIALDFKENAKEAFEKVIKVEKDNLVALHNYANVLQSLGFYDKYDEVKARIKELED